MEQIKKFMLPEHTNNLYEKEAISSISLTKEVANKINEIIDRINQFEQGDLEWKQTQEGTIRKGILYMKDNLVNSLNELMQLLVDSGFIENRIEGFTDLLSKRLDNLINSLPSDGELRDIRTGADGVVYGNAGNSVRGQFENLMKTVIAHSYSLPFEVLGNLVDFEDITYGEAIDNEGNQTTSTGLAVSGFIKVDPLKQYTTKTSFSSPGGAYDINKNYLGKIYDVPTGTPSESVLTFSMKHKNTAYIRVNMLASGASAKSFYLIEAGKENELPCVKIPRLSVDGRTYLGETVSNSKNWIGKKWCCVGDSITEPNDRATTNYTGYISKDTGITVVNMGVSGTGYKRREETNSAFYQRISSVPTDSDVVTIFGSGNDIGLANLGTPNDTGTNTLCGCINTTIDNLIAIYPGVSLGIITPTPWQSSKPGIGSEMEAYANAMVEICKNRSIPCLDLYHCSNLRPWTEEGRTAFYSKDEGNGVHPDENGHKMIAPRIREFISTLI